MIAESGCVGVCLFVLGGGEARMHTYCRSGPAVPRQLCTVYSISSTPQPSPLSVTHTPCAHHCPSLHHQPPPPHLPSVLQSAHFAVYTCVCIQSKLYAKSDLLTYTSIHVFVRVYNTGDKLLPQEKLVPAIFASKLPFWRPVVARRYEDDILKFSL